MMRTVAAGPLLVALGCLVLVVGLFLPWYGDGVTAWRAFETLDLVLAVASVGALLIAAGLVIPSLAVLPRRRLPALAAVAMLVSVSQLLDPPPGVPSGTPGAGLWLALVGALVLVAGTVLTFASVSVVIQARGRDTRRRVPAVDLREPVVAGGDDA